MYDPSQDSVIDLTTKIICKMTSFVFCNGQHSKRLLFPRQVLYFPIVRLHVGDSSNQPELSLLILVYAAC